MVLAADWSKERRQQLVSLYQAGNSMVECCQIMKAGQAVVQRYLKLEKVEIRPQGIPHSKVWSPEKRKKCVELYQQGNTQYEIADLLKAGQAHVSKILAEEGIVFECRWTSKRIQQAIELYAEGHSISHCCKVMKTNGSTLRHYLKQSGVRLRTLLEVVKRGADNPNWKGGRAVIDGGYIYVKCPEDHPHPTSNGYILEHRLVMEEKLGRYLLRTEVVHHRDKNKHNNLIENLEVFSSNAEHLAHELKGQIPKWTEEGKKNMRLAAARRKAKARKSVRSRIHDLP